MSGCSKPIEVWVESGWHGKLVTMKCGQTGVTGYPELCDACSKKFDPVQYRRDVAECGERIEEDE